MTEEVPTPPMTLVVEMPDGQQHPLPVHGPGGHVCVGVGRPGYRAGVWRIWAGKRKSDVFVAARVLGGLNKISLHESGDWRHQWANRDLALELTGKEDRVLDRWPRPAPDQHGWTKSLSIWTPAGELLEIPDDTEVEDDDHAWLPEPEPGIARGVHILIAKPNLGEPSVQGAFPLAGFTLANGEAVLVFVGRAPADDEKLKWLETHRQLALSRLSSGFDLSVGSPRMTLFGREDPAGYRLLYDLAARRQNRQ